MKIGDEVLANKNLRGLNNLFVRKDEGGKIVRKDSTLDWGVKFEEGCELVFVRENEVRLKDKK
ncbi:hypothetical protein HYW53_00615 [Candidatus Giovannonibacteria bacterium]|nr:hypothetical protein [Candidatus Giovannonibacteria bacterium]